MPALARTVGSMTATLLPFPRPVLRVVPSWRPRLGEPVMVSLVDDRFNAVWHEGVVREMHVRSGLYGVDTCKGRVIVSAEEMAPHPGGEAA